MKNNSASANIMHNVGAKQRKRGDMQLCGPSFTAQTEVKNQVWSWLTDSVGPEAVGQAASWRIKVKAKVDGIYQSSTVCHQMAQGAAGHPFSQARHCTHAFMYMCSGEVAHLYAHVKTSTRFCQCTCGFLSNASSNMQENRLKKWNIQSCLWTVTLQFFNVRSH